MANPNPDPTPTPTPTLTLTPISNTIRSAPRKLPIKRKPPPLSQTLDFPAPIPNPNPNPASSFDDDYDDDDDDEQPQQTTTLTNSNQPPFKFHRIWSEPDELRFLQGLLGCWSQGLVFPRDLNIFYDRFSESMPQPYSRSQLSEKLRRLRKKYRATTARIARGLDPNRLSPHDRDLLHLCTRLWDPKHTSMSPFSQPESNAANAAAPTPSDSSGSKRGRPNPNLEEEEEEQRPELVVTPEDNSVGSVVGGVDNNVSYSVAKAVLDVFDGSLEEMRVSLRGGDDGCDEGKRGLEKRWREQRIAELGVFARRLRLVLEETIR